MELTTGSLSPEAMFRMAQDLTDDRLAAILAGQDNAVPQFIAQAVLSDRQRKRQASAGMQAQQQMEQQPLNKKQELLSQFTNYGGIAAAAPASVANMAGGGIVAFSGEDDNDQLVRQPKGAELPGILDALKYGYGKLTGAGKEFLSNRVKQHAQDVSDINISGPPSRYAGLPTGIAAVAKTPPAEQQAPPSATSAPAAPAAPAQAPGGVASLPAAATAPIDVNKFFPALGAAPTMAPFERTNPYEIDRNRSALEYIAEQQTANQAMGVSDTPQAELKKSLLAKKANEAKDEKILDATSIINLGTLMAGAGGKNAFQNIALSSNKALKQYQSDMDKFKKTQEERDKALNEIAVAENEIKRGYVTTGMARRDAGLKDVRAADFTLADIQQRHAATEAQLGAQIYGTQATRGTAIGSAAVQAELSRQQIAAQIKIAQANIAARGDRVPSEIQLLEWAQSNPKNMETLMAVQAAKRPVTGVDALLQNAGIGGAGAQGFDPSKVKQIGK